MITIQNLDILLAELNYQEERKGIYKKVFNEGTANEFSITVDKNNKKFLYPKGKDGMTIHRLTTANFSENENFVVFEAVTRLFDIGYLPKNIELEFSINLGRGQGKVAGWADILVKSNDGQPFMVIEAKTSGKEFESAWKKTLQDGYQLFSYVDYFKTKQKFPYGVLYTSDITNNALHRTYKLISFTDNEDFLKQEKKSKRKLYKNASNSKELYQVWKETYDCDFSPIGALELDVESFNILEKRFTINDIFNNPLDTDGLIHKFRTILRQHNVSGRENAFDRLLNLLLAKIVDEKQSFETGKPLDFYWRGLAFDDKKALVDRLQRLYRDGMKDYLHEDVTYIDRNDVNNAFILFKNDEDATKDVIQDYFEKLKFYTDNFFSFIDVYNEELFNKNFEVLSEIVKLFQNISLTNTTQHQFLGDLFEKLLDQGIKQSEGQFFTPIPIVKFLVSSLPIEEMIRNGEIPKVIDYASGSGHFLTEYASEIKSIISDETVLSKYYGSIFGIEKESRLAKVSKVSALMYGANETQIFFHDALSKFEDIQDNSFDILISNPPYSVKGFLETLSKDERNQFELSKLIKNIETNSSIETFFIERANQLLKAGGMAAIILPSSILQKNEAVFVKTRKIILENFDIIAIFEAGSGTFGKTGTTTDTMFLRKKANKLNLYNHFLNRTNSWYNKDFSKDIVFKDENLLEEFAKIIGLSKDNILANKKFQEHLIYFMIASQQKVNVLIVKTPTDKKEVKKFLGYDWSNRKGTEGIVYPNGAIDKISTPMYNPNNKNDSSKLNNAISKNFLGELDILPDEMKANSLTSLIDWKNESLDLAININRPSSPIPIKLKDGERLVSLGDDEIFEIGIGRRIINSELEENGQFPVYSANVKTPFGYINKLLIEDFSKPSVIWGIDGDWQTGYIKENTPFYPTDHIGYLRVKKNDILPKFIVRLIEEKGKEMHFSRSNRASLKKIKNIQILIPSLAEQEKIVKEYERIELEQVNARQEINNLNEQIDKILEQVKGNKEPLDSVATVEYGYTTTALETGDIRFIRITDISENGKLRKENCMFIKLTEESNKFLLQKDDILVARTGATYGKTLIWEEDDEGVFASFLIRLRFNEKIIPYFYYIFTKTSDYWTQAENLKGGTGQPQFNGNAIKQIQIPVPSLSLQEQIINEVKPLEREIDILFDRIDKLEIEKKAIQ